MKKTKQLKKLSLNKQTIQNLTDDEMKQVVGGELMPTAGCSPCSCTASQWPICTFTGKTTLCGTIGTISPTITITF
jgi:natural product precursor